MPEKKYEDYKAPWEVTGEDLDPEKIKRHYWNLLNDLEAKKSEVTTLTGERDELKAKVDEFETKDLSEVERLRRENEQLKSAKPSGDDLDTVRLRLALKHGLTERQAFRLQGSTAEELEADVEVLKEEMAPPKSEEESSGPPKGRFSTGNDHGDQTEDYDPDKYADIFD